MILKLSGLRVVALASFAKIEWKDFWDFEDIEYQKRISHSTIRWLSLYSSFLFKDSSDVPTFIFM